MGLFKHTAAAEIDDGSKAPISSVLGKELDFHGNLTFKGKAQVDGSIVGNVTGEHLVLSEVGRIKGDIVVDSLLCHGHVEGNITAKLLTLAAKSSVQGRINAINLSVEAGAAITGEIQANTSLPPLQQSDNSFEA